ncbi:MAG: CpsD/CapB family tyrosine-protein kinase [Gammaproteobacteria bacterium]|nr:CpsD/CapB family tyrosine-protein kinase [Gammaproteobacteria bacterium]
MSKIEKALNKVRDSGRLQMISSVPEQESSVPVRLDSKRENGDETALIEHRASATEAIAHMHEITLLGQRALAERCIIHPELGENSAVRPFREIRTKIIQKSKGRNCVIMVTSVTGSGGSSFVTFNLGVAFALDDSKTALLIDCNFRNSSLHELFPGKKHLGLTDYLENPEMDIADVIHPVGIKRLRIIPSGARREISAEYFTSVKMKQMIDSIKNRYRERYVIIDAPPTTESADMQILADLCDYVILIVPYGRVKDSQVEACVKSIPDSKLLGIVFNNEPTLPVINWWGILNPFLALWHRIFSRS